MSTHGGGGGGGGRSASRQTTTTTAVRERQRRYGSASSMDRRAAKLDAEADRLYAQQRSRLNLRNPAEQALADALTQREQTRMLLSGRGAGFYQMTPALQQKFEQQLAEQNAAVTRRANALRALGGNPDLYLRAEAARLAADHLAAEADRARGGSGAEVHLTEAARTTTRDIFGHDLPRSAWANMAGGVPGGYIGIALGGSGRTLNIHASGAHMHASHQVYRMGRDVIWHTEIAESDQGSRTSAGGATIMRGLTSMRDNGISKVDATAARGAGYNGYATWARAGATGPIPSDVLPAARARFGDGVHNVEDIMQASGGPAWWRQHGDTWHATFDFSNPYTRDTIDRFAQAIKRHNGA